MLIMIIMPEPVGRVTAVTSSHDSHVDESRQSRTDESLLPVERAGPLAPVPWLQASRCISMQREAACSPCLCGTRCGVQKSVTKLRNVPRCHLASGQAQAVPSLQNAVAVHVQMGALQVMCTWIFSLVGVCGSLPARILYC